MVNIKLEIQKPSRFGMPISGHQCALRPSLPVMTVRDAAIVRDRAFGGVVLGLGATYTGAFPGTDAWSPPI